MQADSGIRLHACVWTARQQLPGCSSSQIFSARGWERLKSEVTARAGRQHLAGLAVAYRRTRTSCRKAVIEREFRPGIETTGA